MTHQPYLDWLYEDAGELTEVQTAGLHDHLHECGECRARAATLRRMETALQITPMLSPAAGFAARWQARLQEERQRAHRRQTRLALGISIAALTTVLGALILLAWPYLGSLKTAFWAFAYQMLSVYVVLTGIREFITQFMLSMASVVPLMAWLLAIGMVFELGVLWVVSYRLLTNPRRIEIA